MWLYIKKSLFIIECPKGLTQEPPTLQYSLEPPGGHFISLTFIEADEAFILKKERGILDKNRYFQSVLCGL